MTVVTEARFRAEHGEIETGKFVCFVLPFFHLFVVVVSSSIVFIVVGRQTGTRQRISKQLGSTKF